MDTVLQQLINGLSLGAIYALIALGYTMVYGVLRLINFAHGDVYMLGAFAGYYLANALDLDASPSILGAIVVTLGAMAICAVIGMLIERFAYRPVRHHSRLTSLITAIGVSLLLEYGGQVVFGANPRFFPQMIRAEVYSVGGVQITNQNLLIIVVAIVVMFGLEFIVHRTRIGKAMRATSFNLSVAKLMGINTDYVIAFTFALGSALAAAGGVMVALAIPRIDPLMGLMTGLKAFVAAVLGGIGSIPGAMIGGVLIGLLETWLSATAYSTYRDAAAFAVLILILLFRPAGIMGSRDGREGLGARVDAGRNEAPRYGRHGRRPARPELPVRVWVRRFPHQRVLRAHPQPDWHQRHPGCQPESDQRARRSVLHRACRLHGGGRL